VHRPRPPRPRTLVHQTQPPYPDMIIKLRRVLIAAQYHPGAAEQPAPEQIRDIQLAWARAAA
jgi:hypothetical protein